MSTEPFTPRFENLPATLPVFPLEGVLLLPHGQLPLNIFEPRYIAMVDAALSRDRLIGMIQPKGERDEMPGNDIFKTGCAGRITHFQETDDGRYLITLTGVCRFRVREELNGNTGFRQVRPDWTGFQNDLQKVGCLNLNRARLTGLLHEYFAINHLSMDWDLIDVIADESLLTALAMICPLSASEKQALLEAPCCKSRADLFVDLLEIAVRQGGHCCSSH